MKQNDIKDSLKKDFFLSDEKAEKIAAFSEIVSRETQKIALISKKSALSIYDSHIYDSLTSMKLLQGSTEEKIIDLGSGGGFPVVPLAIVYPEKCFYAVDSIKKKTHFLEQVSRELQLHNITIINDRIEVVGHMKNYREAFDCVVSRALASLPVVLEYASALLKIGGRGIFFKTDISEINRNAKAATTLGLQHSENKNVSHHGLDRFLFVYTKIKTTPPLYPRETGVPTKTPL